MNNISPLFILSADVVAQKLIPRHGCSISALLPNCIKAVILHKLTKRGLVTSVELFQSLLSDHSTTLDLSAHPNADDRFLEAIAQAQMNHLEKIDLNALKGFRDGVTNTGIETLAKSKSAAHLQVIFLRRCRLLENSSISALIRASCHSLKSLCLAGCPNVNDQTLSTVAETCHLLEGADVSGTKITDAGLDLLASSPLCNTLTELKVTHCSTISADGVRAIFRACKKLRIFRFDGCSLIDAEETAILLGEHQNWQWHRVDGDNSKGSGSHTGLKQVSWTIY